MSESASANLKAVATGQPIVKKSPPKDFPAMLQAWKGEIAVALPKHLSADRMARVALTCFRNTPKLAECNPLSVFAAVLQAAQLGIEPGLMGEAYLIPYKDTCQLIPGYAGLIKLAKQTGQVVDIYAMAVRENDKFNCTFGLTRTLDHSPLADKGGFPASQEKRGAIIGHYAVAVFKDGSRTFVVMGMDEVHAIRNNSSGYKQAVKWKKDSPWTTHPEEMGNKTAIRRLCKMLPKSPELAQALAMEDAHNRGQAQNIDTRAVLDGSYSVVSDDAPDADAATIDQDTGEITGGSPHEPAAPVSTAQQSQQSPKQSNAGNPMLTAIDACAKISTITDADVLDVYLDGLPAELRGDERVTAAYHQRQAALASTGADEPTPTPTPAATTAARREPSPGPSPKAKA